MKPLSFRARLELDKKEIFVIGMDVAHPAPATPHQLYSMRQKQINYQSFDPSVVGVCRLNLSPNLTTTAFVDQRQLREEHPLVRG